VVLADINQDSVTAIAADLGHFGKEVYSDFDIEALRQKMPIQTGAAAEAIAAVCRQLIHGVEYAATEQGVTTRHVELARELSRPGVHEFVQ
jgi:hypothetical protein